MSERMIEIELLRCTVVLSPSEIQHLLRLDKPLYKKALRRGKHIKRGRTQRERENQKFQEHVDMQGIDFPF